MEEEQTEGFFENEEGRKLILGQWNLIDGQETMMVSCEVAAFTIEAKAGEYQAIRGYAQVEPENLWIHVLVHNPAQLIDESGDVQLFGSVFRYIARELDMAVMDTARNRLDREAIRPRVQAYKPEGQQKEAI